MSDPLRTDAVTAADALAGRARDARVEELLLAGLDQYFAGRYDQAIHIWTRVLFLDRGHARARAYIERARSAEAERDRESNELLQRGTQAFEAGQPGAARRLLTAAVERGAPPEVAFAYLGRLDRLTPVAALVEPATPAPTPPASSTAPAPGTRRIAWLTFAVGGVAVVGVMAGAWYAMTTLDLADAWREPVPQLVLPSDEPVLVPHRSELALERASRLFAAGRTDAALRVLATIPDTDPRRHDADRLLADIQGRLLAGTRTEDLP